MSTNTVVFCLSSRDRLEMVDSRGCSPCTAQRDNGWLFVLPLSSTAKPSDLRPLMVSSALPLPGKAAAVPVSPRAAAVRAPAVRVVIAR
jgi:hypothetical protein